MAFIPNDDLLQLSKRHEEILGQRAVLLQQMEICYEQQKEKKQQLALMSAAASERNTQILQDLVKVEKHLQSRPLLHPDVLNLQTRYWVSMEQKLPEWESYLLGKGPAPVRDESRSRVPKEQNGTRQACSPARDQGKPPRPKTRSAVCSTP